MTPEEIDAEAREDWRETWDETVARLTAEGAVVHTPNGLPVRCIRHDGMMLECGNGDHPNYLFPVFVEYIGQLPEDTADWERDYLSHPQLYAVIFADDAVVLTLFECCYYLFHHTDNGRCANDPDLRLTPLSCVWIKERLAARSPAPPAPRPGG